MIKKSKVLFLSLAILLAGFLTASAAILQGYQGGTGFGTGVLGGGAVGDVLQIASTSPFLTYTWTPASSISGGGAWTTNNNVVNLVTSTNRVAIGQNIASSTLTVYGSTTIISSGSTTLSLFPQGNSGGSASLSGAFYLNNTNNAGIGANFYNNTSTQTGASLIFAKQDHASNTKPVARFDQDGEAVILDLNGTSVTTTLDQVTLDYACDSCIGIHIVSTDPDNSQGLIRLDSPAPEIEFVDTDLVSPAGEFEVRSQNDWFQINGRAGDDSGFQRIVEIQRLADGGNMVLVEGDSISPVARFEILNTSTSIDYFAIESTTTAPGNIFMIKRSTGNVGIGTSTPQNNLSIVGGLQVTGLVSCDSLDTTASGTVVCGSDTGGSGDSVWSRNNGSGFIYTPTTTDYVGIGTVSPSTQLEVAGSSTFNGRKLVLSNNILVGASSSISDFVGVNTAYLYASATFGGNKTININDGSYAITNSTGLILSTDDTRIIGSGRGITLFTHASTTGSTIELGGEDNEDVPFNNSPAAQRQRLYIADLTLQQDSTVSTTATSTGLNMSFFTKSSFDRLDIRDYKVAVYASGVGTHYNSLRDISVVPTGTPFNYGFYFDNRSIFNQIDNTRVQAASGTTICYYVGSQSQLFNNPNCEARGYLALDVDDTGHSLTMINPYFEGFHNGIRFAPNVEGVNIFGGQIADDTVNEGNEKIWHDGGCVDCSVFGARVEYQPIYMLFGMTRPLIVSNGRIATTTMRGATTTQGIQITDNDSGINHMLVLNSSSSAASHESAILGYNSSPTGNFGTFRIRGGAGSGLNNSFIAFDVASGTSPRPLEEAMRILKGGTVAIGTTTPSSTVLSVVAKPSVYHGGWNESEGTLNVTVPSGNSSTAIRADCLNASLTSDPACVRIIAPSTFNKALLDIRRSDAGVNNQGIITIHGNPADIEMVNLDCASPDCKWEISAASDKLLKVSSRGSPDDGFDPNFLVAPHRDGGQFYISSQEDTFSIPTSEGVLGVLNVSSSVNTLTLGNSSSTPGNFMKMDGSGNLFLGDQVAGVNSGQLYIGTSTSPTSSPALLIKVTSTQATSVNMVLTKGGSGGTRYIVLNAEGSFGGSAPQIAWTNTAGALTTGQVESAGGTSFVNSFLKFSVANPAKVLTERMRITANGGVGIGTTTPTGVLTVVSSTATSTVQFGGATFPTCLILGDSDGAGVTYVTALNGVLSAGTTPCN